MVSDQRNFLSKLQYGTHFLERMYGHDIKLVLHVCLISSRRLNTMIYVYLTTLYDIEW